jgi:hypothetical protein
MIIQILNQKIEDSNNENEYVFLLYVHYMITKDNNKHDSSKLKIIDDIINDCLKDDHIYESNNFLTD